MNRATYFTLIALVLVSTTAAQAAPTARWTPARAAAKIKTTYTTVDAKGYAVVQANIDAQLAAGKGEDDPIVVSLRAALEKTKRSARPITVSCRATAKPIRFRCTTVVQGVARVAPDYKLYRATKKLTFVTVGSRFKILEGWH